jgi:hypothetical protein
MGVIYKFESYHEYTSSIKQFFEEFRHYTKFKTLLQLLRSESVCLLPQVVYELPIFDICKNYIEKGCYEKIDERTYRIKIKSKGTVTKLLFLNIPSTRYLKHLGISTNGDILLNKAHIGELFGDDLNHRILETIKSLPVQFQLLTSDVLENLIRVAKEFFKREINLNELQITDLEIIDLETIELTITMEKSICKQITKLTSRATSLFKIKVKTILKEPLTDLKDSNVNGTLIHHYFLTKDRSIIDFAMNEKNFFDKIKNEYSDIEILDIKRRPNKTIGNNKYVRKSFDNNFNIETILVTGFLH